MLKRLVTFSALIIFMFSLAANAEDSATKKQTHEASKKHKKHKHARKQRKRQHLDLDRDGLLSKEEITIGLKKRFVLLDVNKDGKLTFEEFSAKSRKHFDYLDKNKNGKLDRDERPKRRIKVRRGHRKNKVKEPSETKKENS